MALTEDILRAIEQKIDESMQWPQQFDEEKLKGELAESLRAVGRFPFEIPLTLEEFLAAELSTLPEGVWIPVNGGDPDFGVMRDGNL